MFRLRLPAFSPSSSSSLAALDEDENEECALRQKKKRAGTPLSVPARPNQGNEEFDIQTCQWAGRSMTAQLFFPART
jgi:hypothetical protein